MLALLQRVNWAKVEVQGHIVGEIGPGILLFLGIEKQDTEEIAGRLLEKVLGYRIFADSDDKMNLNIKDIAGELLIVSQFTLAADTKKGLRPSFSTAADPGISKQLYGYFVSQAEKQLAKVETGEFGANMQVSLENDGPVTFMLGVNSQSQ